jgi:hypothetical protein
MNFSFSHFEMEDKPYLIGELVAVVGVFSFGLSAFSFYKAG